MSKPVRQSYGWSFRDVPDWPHTMPRQCHVCKLWFAADNPFDEMDVQATVCAGCK